MATEPNTDNERESPAVTRLRDPFQPSQRVPVDETARYKGPGRVEQMPNGYPGSRSVPGSKEEKR